MEIQMGGGRGGSKNRAFRHRGVDFFWNNPIHIVTDAKLKQQTETATTTRESSDIHTNTL